MPLRLWAHPDGDVPRPPAADGARRPSADFSVIGFGLATIVFGILRDFYLSLGMMFLIGALDNISVVIRHTLVQILTPDEMRGRVSAVNGLFISMSNQLGETESGIVAKFFDPTIAVVSGGIGTLIVVALAALWRRSFGIMGGWAGIASKGLIFHQSCPLPRRRCTL